MISGKGLIAKEIHRNICTGWRLGRQPTVKMIAMLCHSGGLSAGSTVMDTGVFCIHIPTFSLKPCGYQEATVAERAAGLQFRVSYYFQIIGFLFWFISSVLYPWPQQFHGSLMNLYCLTHSNFVWLWDLYLELSQQTALYNSPSDSEAPNTLH